MRSRTPFSNPSACRRSTSPCSPSRTRWVALALTAATTVLGCEGPTEEHGHHIPPEVEAAAQYETFTHHLGGAEYAPANWVKSPNYSTAWRGKGQIKMIIVHTTQGSYNGAVSWFKNPKSKVSAHYVISKYGQITQMVKEKDIGWHVGSANGYTIGIEHEGFVSNPTWATPKMVAASAKLTCYLLKKYGLPATRSYVKGHVELPNQTHTDPGKYWPWASYMSQIQACTKTGGSSSGGGSSGGGSSGGTGGCGSCDDGNVCTKDTCISSKCSHSWDNGKVCWDGDACTVGEKCTYGKCIGGKIVKDCNDNNACTTDGCKNSKCTHTANSHSCSDGNPCTVGDVCKAGSCSGGKALGCNDGNPCTKDSCSATGCKHAAITGPCNDGNPCTVGDVCAAGSCQAGTPKQCSDNNPCTIGDTCDKKTGVCGKGVPKQCGQGDSCGAGVCDPKTGGCQPVNEGKVCDDHNPCTASSVCKAGTCTSVGAVMNCDDKNPCTDDYCAAAGCSHNANAMYCDDGNSCTLNDRCTAGSCRGEALDCDDGDPCTLDHCTPQAGCVHDPSCGADAGAASGADDGADSGASNNALDGGVFAGQDGQTATPPPGTGLASQEGGCSAGQSGGGQRAALPWAVLMLLAMATLARSRRRGDRSQRVHK